MDLRRFFAPPDRIHDGIARLPPDESHHLRHVLKLQVGDIVEVFDGEGRGYEGKIVGYDDIAVIGDLERVEPASEPPIEVILALALIKSDKFDWVLQKGTEMGVRSFVPLETHFCDVRIPECKQTARLSRWRRIVREAAKQSRRFCVPRVHPPWKFAEFLASAEFNDATKILFYEKALDPWNGKSIPSRRLVLCIGPEGGWDPKEIAAAERAAFRTFRLGPRILRSETAALAALAILQYRLGDLGPHEIR